MPSRPRTGSEGIAAIPLSSRRCRKEHPHREDQHARPPYHPARIDPRPRVRRPVRGHLGPRHRERRSTVDAGRPRRQQLVAAVGRHGLRLDARRWTTARRTHRRPLRPPQHVGRRAGRVRPRLPRRRAGRIAGRARRRPRRPGHRWSTGRAGRAVHPHRDLPGGTGPQPRPRPVRSRRWQRRLDRRAGRWGAHQWTGMGVGVPHQRAHRPGVRRARRSRDPRIGARRAAATGRRRCRPRDDRVDRRGLRHQPQRRARMGLDHGPRVARHRRRAAGRCSPSSSRASTIP